MAAKKTGGAKNHGKKNAGHPRPGSGEKKREKNSRNPLEGDEEIEILEGIARTGSAIAKIQALRMLEKRRSAEDEPDSEDEDDEFAELDELAPRRSRRA